MKKHHEPEGRYCGNQMCCWGPAGKKPPQAKNIDPGGRPVTKAVRKLLVDSDSALSLIFHRKRSAIRELGEDFEREIEQLLTRLRSASEQRTEPKS